MMPEEVESDEEAAQQQALYVAELAADCPQYEPDSRQSALFDVLDDIRKEGEHEDVAFIPMGGFRASQVDLGWLLDKAYKAVEELHEEFGPRYICGVLEGLIQKCVQRMKLVTTRYDGVVGSIKVCFTTKDDEGWYDYSFEVSVPRTDETVDKENTWKS